MKFREKEKDYTYIHDALDALSSLLDLMDEVVLEVIWISDGHLIITETNKLAICTFGALGRAKSEYGARIHVVNSNEGSSGVSELQTWAEDLSNGELFQMDDLETLVDPMIVWRGPVHLCRMCPAHFAATRRDPHFLNKQIPRSSPSFRKPASSPDFVHQPPSSSCPPLTSSSHTLPSSERGSYQIPDQI